MTLVIDASVAVKFFFPESGHDQATAILESAEPIAAPDIIIPEILNVLWKKSTRGEISRHQANEVIANLPMTIPTIIPSVEIANEAFVLAENLRHPVYDCLYLAGALASGALLITADESFVRKVSVAGLGPIVVDIKDWSALFVGTRAIPLRRNLIQEVERLSALVQKTFRALGDSAKGSAASGLPVIPAAAYAPAFDSPAYRRLKDLVNSLSGDEIAQLVALAWLGRGHEHGDLGLHVENARLMIGEDHRQHTPYIISILPTVALGYERYQQAVGNDPTH